ncbi:MAG: flagellar protein FlaG [Deltaproteobacteria bacterium]|nr:flagellar protein FlaG [Deltaproteobacteria bacterium]
MVKLITPAKALGNSLNIADLNFPDLNQRSADISQRWKKQSNATEKVQRVVQAKIARIAEAMDKYINSVQKDLHITFHNSTGKVLVKVISEENGKVIREIPAEELLDLAAKLEEMTGALFNENA